MRAVSRLPPPVDPADRRARVAVTVLFLINGALLGTFATRIPAIQAGLGAGPGQLGAALLAIAAGALVAMPIAGRQAARHGSRPGTLIGMGAMALMLPLTAVAPNVAVLALSLFAFGLFAGTQDVSMNAHGVTVERRYGRPILSSFHAAFSMGGLLGAAVGALAAALGIGPLAEFAAVSAVLATTGVLAGRWLLPREADRVDEPSGLRLPPRPIALLGLLAFCGLFGEGASGDWSAVYLAGSLGAAPATAALGFGAFSLSMTVGRLLGDRAVSRFGPVIVTRGGAMLAAGGLAFGLVIAHPAAAILGFGCLGAGLSSMVPILFRAGAAHRSVAPGVGIAGVATVGYLGLLAGPPTIGFFAELVGLRLALGVVVLLVAILAVFAARVVPSDARGIATVPPGPAVAEIPTR